MPKSLEVGRKNGKSAAKKTAQKADVAPTEAPVAVVIPVEDSAAAGEPVAVSEPAVADVAVEAKKTEKVAAEPAVVAQAVVPETQNKPAASVESSSKPVKKAKKVRKARKAKVVEQEESQDSSVVPPEWDWFKTPLKVELSQGKVEIVAAVEVAVASVSENVAVVEAKPAVVSADPAPVVVPAREKDEPAAVTAVEEKPFALALARMAKIRQIRAAREEAKPQTVVDSGSAVEKSSPTMQRMGDVIEQLIVKLDRNASASAAIAGGASGAAVAEPSVDTTSAAVATEEAAVEPAASFEEAQPVKASGGSEEPESEESMKFKPYYSGSGSSFSTRVNEMIKRGDWLKD
jgi:hypothetical protein